MTNVAVIGATGYAGADLVRILRNHPDVSLTMITSRQYSGRPFADVYPAMAGVVDLTCQSYSEAAVSEAADVIFTALPHKASMGVVRGLVARGKRVIDLSADFRFKDQAVYEAWYEAVQDGRSIWLRYFVKSMNPSRHTTWPSTVTTRKWMRC